MAQRKIGSGGIGNNIEFAGNYIQLPAGTTAERPVSPENGQMRFNTTLGKLEQYNINGWQAIDTPPIVSTLSYSGSLLAADPAGGETITVTGSNFTSSVTVTIDGTLAPTVSVVDANTVTFTTPAKTAGDYDVTVTNNTGLGSTLSGGISYNGTPSFTTAAGKIGNDLAPGSAIQTITIVAAEPDGGALAYSVTSGALPSGLSLASDGDITGTTPTPATTTTYNFTVTATDDENQTNSRAFNLVVLRPVYAYSIPQSLMFEQNDDQYLERTIATTTNQRTFTASFWVKMSRFNTSYQRFIDFSDPNDGGSGEAKCFVAVNIDGGLAFQYYQTSTGSNYYGSYPQFLRDPSAWYHIVWVMDTTEAVQADRVKIYINGELAEPSSNSFPPQNTDTYANRSGSIIRIGNGVVRGVADRHVNGYMAEVHFIDGQALTPTSFAETYNDVWVPKAYSGSYGTNGFHLPMTNDTSVEAFNTVTYVGNGGVQSLTGYGFKPDFVWIKNRDSGVDYHNLYDAVRGPNLRIYSNGTNAEEAGHLTSFDSDGFTLNTNNSNVNGSGTNYVAWGWKAGDSNVSNTDGSITSTVRTNDTYGFSIVQYSGNATSGATVGHGLSTAPDFIIAKTLDTTGYDWPVYHSSLSGPSYVVTLNLITEEQIQTNKFNGVAPTSSVITLGNHGTNVNGTDNQILYCWSERAGYSKFGSYTGNGSTTGPIITTGFKPALVILKPVSAADHWNMYDNTRDTTNPTNALLFPNRTNAEGTGQDIEITDTGFQLKNNNTGSNGNGTTYIYIAFADTRDNAFWRDESGNNNNWQPVNTGAYRVTTDTPTE